MQSKYAQVVFSSLVLLGSAAQVQADDQLQYASLGSGEDIREEVVADNDADADAASGEDKTTQGKCSQGSCGNTPKPSSGGDGSNSTQLKSFKSQNAGNG
ncbi:MAG: hypothetical protein KGZ39_01265 [Simkania sp.]|nr:hypothetical protein [Simkania sp.]